MAGFIRRFQNFPGTEVITAIEGVDIIDLPPPGSINGVGVGTAALVGEFSDVRYAVSIDSSGGVTSKPQPVEVFSSQDMLNKVGGFDSSLGNFGGALGNGFVELRNKKFSRLILVPVNNASSHGYRVWRVLPTNTSATNTTPVVPMAAATVGASREFKSSTNRVRNAMAVSFTDDAAYAAGTDGVIAPAGLPAATQTFSSAAANFVASGVKKGDALVIGVLPPPPTSVTDNPLTAIAVVANVISTAGFPSSGTLQIDSEQMTYSGVTATSFTGLTRAANGTVAASHAQGASVNLVNDSGTYRVNAITDANNLVVERQNGSNFTATTWIALTNQPWRIHVASTADTGGNNTFSQAAGYNVPARPLDATIVASTLLSPTIVPPAASASSWDSLSGLAAATDPSTGLVYSAAVQAPNAANSASLDALYVLAIDSLLSQELPAREVNLVWSARKSSNIRNKLKSHVLLSSSQGVGRTAQLSPELSVQSLSSAIGDADPGVGANRDERVDYDWPGVTTFVPEAVNLALATADSKTTMDGNLDSSSDGWLVSVLSNLPPERNPGEATALTQQVLAPITGIQRGVSGLSMNDYIQLKKSGICAPRIDRAVGPIFQSGKTTSLTSGQLNINRRRMADFIEDSLAIALEPFSKQLLTNSLKDGVLGEVTAFMDELLSINNPAAQRISDYEVDIKSGNTPELEAKGIFVIIVRVRTLATADFIVLQAEIGEGVTITRA